MERYKQIKYQNYSNISLIEFDLLENEIFEMEDFVVKISQFTELIGHKQPKYVLFNKRLNDFEVDSDFYKFSHIHVLKIIFEYGVSEIFFLVNDERYQKYKNISIPNIFAFKEMTDLIAHIKNVVSV